MTKTLTQKERRKLEAELVEQIIQYEKEDCDTAYVVSEKIDELGKQLGGSPGLENFIHRSIIANRKMEEQEALTESGLTRRQLAVSADYQVGIFQSYVLDELTRRRGTKACKDFAEAAKFLEEAQGQIDEAFKLVGNYFWSHWKGQPDKGDPDAAPFRAEDQIDRNSLPFRVSSQGVRMRTFQIGDRVISDAGEVGTITPWVYDDLDLYEVKLDTGEVKNFALGEIDIDWDNLNASEAEA